MSATHFSGPVVSGTLTTGQTNGPNQGFSRLEQFATIVQSGGALVQSATIYVPVGSRISNFSIDVLTAFNSATSATLSIGTSAGGTQYASGVDVKAATGRIAITFTAAQLAAMAGLTTAGAAAPTVAPVVISITSVGAPSAGVVAVTTSYVQQ